MSRKYIKQVDSYDFVYPNNTVPEYDLEIIHDINDNCVSGTTSGITTSSITSSSFGFSFNYTWSLNGAERYITPSNNTQLLSVHMMGPSQNYFKPFIMVGDISNASLTGTTFSGTFSETISASDLGLTGITSGRYYYEVRFIGKKCVYPICGSFNLEEIPTPTPTPTPTNTPTPTPTSTPTPTPTGPTPTPTPTPTATPTPTPTPTGGTANLDWSFTEGTGGSQGTMDLYVNGSIVESRSSTSSGTYLVYVGDTINVQVTCDACAEPNNFSNAYSISNKPILTDAACGNSTSCSIFTAVYTVVAGDVGNTITLNTFAACDSGCI